MPIKQLLTVLVALGVLRAEALTVKANPIQRVSNMLEGMQEKVTAEGLKSVELAQSFAPTQASGSTRDQGNDNQAVAALETTEIRNRHWPAWVTQFPSLKPAVDGANSSGWAHIWQHLGAHRWMQIIDGKNHSDGPHAYDRGYRADSNGYWVPADFLKLSEAVYAMWDEPSRWRLRWTADAVAQTNAMFRNVSCVEPSCHDQYIRNRSPEEASSCGWGGEICMSQEDLDAALSEYYDCVDQAHSAASVNASLQTKVSCVVELFTQMASGHPFVDGNSRTRLFVLQTELVKIGGHPIVMFDSRDAVYTHTNPWKIHNPSPGIGFVGFDTVKDAILDGWCAWEFIGVTGASPYQKWHFRPSYDASTGLCLSQSDQIA